MSKYHKEELQALYDLNKDRVGMPIISLHHEEVAGSILLRISNGSFTYWYNGKLVHKPWMSDETVEIYMSETECQLLANAGKEKSDGV